MESIPEYALALCFDSRYLRHACATLASLARFGGFEEFEVCLLVDGVDGDGISRLKRSVDNKARLHIVHASEVTASLPSGKAGPAYISDAAYLRLWLPVAFAGVARYLLYLDADALCVASIADLQPGDVLAGNVLGAVQDAEIRTLGHIPSAMLPSGADVWGNRYFNSGVLLLDVELCLSSGFTDRAIDLAFRQGGCLEYGDQDVLNIVSRGEWARLPVAFNCMNYWLFESDAVALRSGVRVVHAAGSLKFWDEKFPLGLRRDLYWWGVRKAFA